jgi:hypothetical protein
MPFPCRFPVAPLPCRSFPFDLHSAVVFDSHIPWHGTCESALCLNQTRPHCVNQIGKPPSKPLAERHGRGTAWERRGMCKSAFNMVNMKVQKFIKISFSFLYILRNSAFSLTRYISCTCVNNR